MEKFKRPALGKAFRDKYLAAFLVTAFLTVASFFGAQAQLLPHPKLQRVDGPGQIHKRFQIDTSFIPPRDTMQLTAQDSGAIAVLPGLHVFGWTGYKWDEIIAGGAGGSDGNNFPYQLQFDTTSGVLTILRQGLPPLSDSSLDKRYTKRTDSAMVHIDTSLQGTGTPTNPLRVNPNLVGVGADGNNFVNVLVFDSTTGKLTIQRQGLPPLTDSSLDGRYTKKTDSATLHIDSTLTGLGTAANPLRVNTAVVGGGSGTVETDDQTILGVGSIADPLKAGPAQQQYSTLATLRAINPGIGLMYKLVINKIPGDFYYDPTDVTSVDDGVMILIAAGGKRLKRYVVDRINVKWFGAIGDGVANDQPACQTATDWVINHPTYPRTIFYPRGTYKWDAPVLASKWNGTDWDFVNFRMLGEDGVSAFTTNTYSTIIKATFGDKFMLGIQLGKSCEVNGFYFSGPADGFLYNYYGSYYQFIKEGPYAGFMKGMSRESPQSPGACINIDPGTHGQMPPDGGYPGMTATLYRGAGGTGGSSNIIIKNCRLYGQTVGIAVSVNYWTLNGESCLFENLSFGQMKTAMACGQDQLKDNHANRLIMWDVVHTGFDNSTYGKLFGNLPHVNGVDIAGMVRRLVNFNDVGRYPLFFKNIFAESLFEIGNIQSSQISVLEDCTFDFATGIYAGLPAPDAYLTGLNVLIRGGSYRIYQNLGRRLFFKGYGITMDNVSVENLPVTRKYGAVGGQQTAFKNVKLTIAGGIAGASEVVELGGSTGYAYVIGSNLTFLDQGSAYGPKKVMFSDPRSESLFDLGTYTVTVDTVWSTATLTMPVAQANALRLGDYLISETSDYAARVDSVSTSTGYVRLAETPLSMRTGSYHLFLNYVRMVGIPFVGDVTINDNVIRNCSWQGTAPFVGMRIESRMFGVGSPGLDIFFGAYVTAVNVGARTVTVNFLANQTKAGVDFQMGDPLTVIHNEFNPSINNLFVAKGTEWIVRSDQAGTKDTKYIFTKGGFTIPTGGNQQAEWYEAPIFKYNATDNVQYYDRATGTYKSIGTGDIVKRDALLNIQLSGGDDPGKANLIMGSNPNSSFDNNLIKTAGNNQSLSLIASDANALSFTNGPFFAMRGVTFSGASGQRGNVYIGSGVVSGAGSGEGAVSLWTGNSQRTLWDKDGGTTWYGRIDYAADYSAGFLPKSLVTKEWVQAAIAALGGNFARTDNANNFTVKQQYNSALTFTAGSNELVTAKYVGDAVAAIPVGETVTLVNTLNYTVTTGTKLQNIIYEFSGGTGTFTLPNGSGADKMVLYITNTTTGALTFSENVYSNSSTWVTTLASTGKMKLVYSSSAAKWYSTQ